MRPTIGQRVAWQIIDGEAVIIDLASGTTIGLNPSATYLWSLIADKSDIDLVEAAAEHFEVSRETAQSDVHEFIDELRRRELIVEGEGA